MLLHKRLSNFPDCIFVILPRPCTYQTLVKKMKKELDCTYPLLFLACKIKHLQFLLQFSQKNHPKGCFFFFFSSFGPYNQLVLVMKSDSRANMHKTLICETGFSFLMHYHNVAKQIMRSHDDLYIHPVLGSCVFLGLAKIRMIQIWST